MSKIRLGIVCGLCCFANAQAGTMGPVSEECCVSGYFISGEGGWTWNQMHDADIHLIGIGRLFTDHHHDNGSGRVSAGVKKELFNGFGALGEIGYGYYGRTRFDINRDHNILDILGPILNLPIAQNYDVNFKATIDGFDVLTGVSYCVSSWDLLLFFEAGAMVQNVRFAMDADFNHAGPLSHTVGTVDIHTDHTQVFPEIRLGASYQIWGNFSVSAAWAHVFGEKPHLYLAANPMTPPGTIDINLENPSLDTFMLGANYTFGI